jgi:hypothetical protein
VFEPVSAGALPHSPIFNSPGGRKAIGLFLFLDGMFLRRSSRRSRDSIKTPIVSGVPIPYTTATEHRMTLLNRIFTTGTLVKIILVLTAVLVMKAASLHYGFSWATALAAE